MFAEDGVVEWVDTYALVFSAVIHRQNFLPAVSSAVRKSIRAPGQHLVSKYPVVVSLQRQCAAHYKCSDCRDTNL
jgi:hypothetical protein